MSSNKFFFALSIVLVSLLVLLALSIVLNAILFDRAKKYYLELNATRLDPLGLDYYPISSDSSETDQKPDDQSDRPRIVIFGDSRAFGWIPPDVGEASEYEFINRGIGSQTSAQVMQRFDLHVAPLNPDVVIIQVGINDLKTIPLFPNRQELIIANCKMNIKRIVEKSRAIGATVIVSTIFPSGAIPLERKPFWSEEIDQAIAQVNTYIASLAAEKVIVFDAFAILADERGQVPSAYTADALHLNEQGYAILNQKLKPILDVVAKL
jgi:lysophospholipase L1-like esterase